jgi:maltose alpha-D-glucosyltransferase/alpha-amylase
LSTLRSLGSELLPRAAQATDDLAHAGEAMARASGEVAHLGEAVRPAEVAAISEGVAKLGDDVARFGDDAAREGAAQVGRTPRWYQDGVKYEIYLRSFRDSNADGIGDFRGLTQQLDYLEHDMPIDMIWVTPFNRSPLRDGGYDVVDFMSVHPDFGTMDDFDEFLKAAHDRGKKVIIDFPLNHTSVDHPWFQRARSAPRGSVERDFYVWSDDATKYSDVPVNFSDFETSNWAWDDKAGQYYWHRWYAHQPDLNYDNPAVVDEIKKTLDFWYAKGVDGVRLDAAPYLVEREGTLSQGLPETLDVIADLRAHVRANFGDDKVLLSEANEEYDDLVKYFGDDGHGGSTGINMAFNFPLMPNLFLGLERQSATPIADALEQTRNIPHDAAWSTFLRNHDELNLARLSPEDRAFLMERYSPDGSSTVLGGIKRRVMPLMGGNKDKDELAHSMLLSQPGTPTIYYADELGMGDNVALRDRESVRLPMPWSDGPGAGFSEADPSTFPLPLSTDAQAVNVAAQRVDPDSMLSRMKRMLLARREHAALRHGDYQRVATSTDHVLAFTRTAEDDRVLAVANLSDKPLTVQLDAAALGGRRAIPFQGRGVSQAGEGAEALTVEPYGYQWFELR